MYIYSNLILFQPGGSSALAVSTTSIAASKPIIGDSASSPYNVHGYASVSVAGLSTYTLTAAQYANHYIEFTGALTANCVVTIPASAGEGFAFANTTTGSFTLTIKVVSDAGAGVALTQGAAGGKFTQVTSDGTRARIAE